METAEAVNPSVFVVVILTLQELGTSQLKNVLWA